MTEKVTPKELVQMMDRMFSVSPKDESFFREQFGELIKTEEGSNLLRLLNSNFSGKKMNLVTKAKPGALGHCFYDEAEIGIGVSSLMDYYFPHMLLLTIQREVDEGYPKLLFHELTHLDQYQNQAGAENAATDEDRYFTTIMGEADAQISGDLFKMQLASSSYLDKGILNPAWQMAKLAGMVVANIKLNSQKKFIAKTSLELQETHPEWHPDRIEKETRKAFFKKSILDKNSSWRRFYDNPENRERLGILNDDPSFPKKEFPDLMKYYMDKYGLTLDECLDLKKEILAQANIKSTKQTTNSTTLHRTNKQVLSHASASRGQPVITYSSPQKTAPQKLDASVLKHLNSGNSGNS